jgi:hypothetical protein
LALEKIVSGGQTGVDRGALDGALDAGFCCGGWCPKGRIAEDGPIPSHYVMVELTHAGYEERTLQNVLDSDGTAILYNGVLEGGTRLTKEYCDRHGKPTVTVDASLVAPDAAATAIAAFIERHRIATLNVAGPRASKWPGAHAYARETLWRLLAGANVAASAGKPGRP